MLLRKHLQNARIVDITQPGLERILHLELEHLNELGDLCRKKLIIEVMGKHSNIIFCDEKDMIIDSIKHISGMVSSVREVLPGRDYFIPQTQDKQNPLRFCPQYGEEGLIPLTYGNFCDHMRVKPMAVYKALYSSYTGISPIMAQEVCYRAGIDADLPANTLEETALHTLHDALTAMMGQIITGTFAPAIIYDGQEPIEFSSLPSARSPFPPSAPFSSSTMHSAAC